MTAEEVISLEDLEKLPEYSCSLPTGTTIGKRWRQATKWGPEVSRERYPETEWMIGTYVDHPDPKLVRIEWVWAVSEPGVPHRTTR